VQLCNRGLGVIGWQEKMFKERTVSNNSESAGCGTIKAKIDVIGRAKFRLEESQISCADMLKLMGTHG
jgi:hypothetical protein